MMEPAQDSFLCRGLAYCHGVARYRLSIPTGLGMLADEAV